MKNKILIFFLLIITLQSIAQSKHGIKWVTGFNGNVINFENNTITTSHGNYINKYFQSGNSNICDTNGKLILCSDGFNIYDSNANYIDGGDTLVNKDYYFHYNGFSPYSQSSIFLPMDSDKYYFITPCNSEGNLCYSCPFNILLYNVIDMQANGGAGKVIKRMQLAKDSLRFSRTQMMACRHGNGKDWWLLKQGYDSNIVHKFLFTQDSVYYKGIQKFNAPVFGNWDLYGQSTFNADGSKYATAVQATDNPGYVSIFDFDRCYGTLSNLEIIHAPQIVFPPNSSTFDQLTTGLAYSPNGRFLYVALQYDIYQYDTQDSSWFIVAGMDTTFAKFQLYANIYLGADNKLYIGNFGGTSKQMSVIDNPDVKGIGCNFCPRCLRLDSLGTNAYVGTPPCMPNYSLGARECYPESTNEIIDKQNVLVVYPNPASTRIFINTKSKQKKELYNSMGQLIFSTKSNEIDVSRLSKGVYYIKCEGQSKKVIIE
jgi:hypothetical protein